MTKILTIRTCHILIGIWIFITAILLYAISVQFVTLNSYDENGCRLAYFDNVKICPKTPKEYDEYGWEFCTGSTKCEINSTMTPKSQLEGYLWVYIVFEIIAQIIAILCWNEHYKWFRFELKSCWAKNEK